MSDTATKRCTTCGATKALTEFYKTAKSEDGRAWSCKSCRREADTVWRARPENRVRACARSRKRRYGLEDETYQQMLASQGGVCAICYQPNTNGKALYVDHCHDTGRVRALLCDGCNFAIGQMKDSPDRLRSAAAYLDRHRSAD